MAKQIIASFPDHVCYAEPFCGGAAVFFAKPLSHVEVLNDINGELVNLYRVVKHHLDEFCRQFRWALTSRELFNWLQDSPPQTLTDIQRAARFYYLQKTAFGAKPSGRNFGTSAHLRLARCLIEHLPWDECIKRYDRPGTLFYADPPYFGTAGYGIDFGMSEYLKLAELARSIEGKILISINDAPEMREVFSEFSIEELAIKYSISNRRSKQPPSVNELLIKNF